MIFCAHPDSPPMSVGGIIIELLLSICRYVPSVSSFNLTTWWICLKLLSWLVKMYRRIFSRPCFKRSYGPWMIFVLLWQMSMCGAYFFKLDRSKILLNINVLQGHYAAKKLSLKPFKIIFYKHFEERNSLEIFVQCIITTTKKQIRWLITTIINREEVIAFSR